MNLFDLSGRVALVTGGSRGLGKALARGLAEAGADIAISSRHENEMKPALADILERTGRKGRYFVADMNKRGDVTALAKSVVDVFGHVDILINNAGSNILQQIDAIRDEDWDKLLELNLTSVMSLTRALVPQMKARNWGRIVHISSMLGLVSISGRNGYSATKAALIGMARATALDLGPFSITVNCIAPGPFLTDLAATLLSPAQKEEFARNTALGRWGDPKELVGPALLLVSDAGSYITGQTIVVDGGYITR